MFTYGLLHDLGKLLFVSILDELLVKTEELDMPLYLEAMHQLHTEFGEKILGKCKFSASYRQVALCHHDLSKPERLSRELLIVHFSNILVRDLGYSITPGGETELIKLESALHLKLNKKMIISIAQRVQDDVEEIKKIL